MSYRNRLQGYGLPWRVALERAELLIGLHSDVSAYLCSFSWAWETLLHVGEDGKGGVVEFEEFAKALRNADLVPGRKPLRWWEE